jgi:hypothetical protein
MDKPVNEKNFLTTLSAILVVVKKSQDKIIGLIRDSEERFKQLLSAVEFKQGEKGEQGLRGEKGDRGEPGEDGVDGRDGKDGQDGRDGRDGKNGVTPNLNQVALEASTMALESLRPLIPTVESIELDIPKLGEPIRDALELLQGDERLDKSAIKGLQEELDRILKIAESKTQIIGGGGVGKQNVYYYDLSSQLNGVLKTFSMPAFARILDVKLSSAPVLRPTVDWTSDANAYTITFTSQIDADPLLNSGQSLLVLYAI